jgi:hypothetical protein
MQHVHAMDDTTSARLAGRATTPLLVLAAACFAMPFAALPGEGAVSGLRFADPARAAAHPEATVALCLIATALAIARTRVRHRISVAVLASGFAATGLLMLQATAGAAVQDSGNRIAESLSGGVGGAATFGPLSSALQQTLAVRWTAAYWVALLATAAVFALNGWALLRQPAPSRPVAPAAPPVPERPAAA